MSEKSPSVQELLKRRNISHLSNPQWLEASPETPIREAVQMMRERKVGYLLLTEEKKIIGIFTETDLARKVLGKPIDWGNPIREIMTEKPLVLTHNDSVGAAIEMMGKNRIYHIPLVTKEMQVTGILSVRSLIRFLAEYYPTEIYNLPPDPDQIMKTPEGG